MCVCVFFCYFYFYFGFYAVFFRAKGLLKGSWHLVTGLANEVSVLITIYNPNNLTDLVPLSSKYV